MSANIEKASMSDQSQQKNFYEGGLKRSDFFSTNLKEIVMQLQ